MGTVNEPQRIWIECIRWLKGRADELVDGTVEEV